MHVNEQFQYEGFIIPEDFNSSEMFDPHELDSKCEGETSNAFFQADNQSATSDEYFLSSSDRKQTTARSLNPTC